MSKTLWDFRENHDRARSAGRVSANVARAVRSVSRKREPTRRVARRSVSTVRGSEYNPLADRLKATVAASRRPSASRERGQSAPRGRAASRTISPGRGNRETAAAEGRGRSHSQRRQGIPKQTPADADDRSSPAVKAAANTARVRAFTPGTLVADVSSARLAPSRESSPVKPHAYCNQCATIELARVFD